MRLCPLQEYKEHQVREHVGGQSRGQGEGAAGDEAEASVVAYWEVNEAQLFNIVVDDRNFMEVAFRSLQKFDQAIKPQNPCREFWKQVSSVA